MPLSDNEQRLLEQMERALYAEDPKFASAMRGAVRRPGAMQRYLIGGFALVTGLVLLVLGVNQQKIPLAIVGFIVMLAGTAYTLSSGRRSGPVGVVGEAGTVRPPAGGTRRSKKKKGSGSFTQRMEERWDKRRNGEQ